MNQTAFLYALLTVILWGVVAILDKIAADRLPAVAIVLIRSVFTLLLIVIYGLAVRQLPDPRAISPRLYLLLFISATLVLVSMVSYFQALRWGEASRVIAFTSVYPLLTILLAVPLLHEPLTLRKALGVLVIVAGLWVLNEPPPREAAGDEKRAEGMEGDRGGWKGVEGMEGMGTDSAKGRKLEGVSRTKGEQP
jgi:transporter family protein